MSSAQASAGGDPARRIAVKICGVTRVEDALVATEAGADFVGLIRAQSARRVADAGVIAIVDALRGRAARPVLLFADHSMEVIRGETDAFGVSHVQLHGAESAELVNDLKTLRPELALIKAWPVTSSSSPAALRDYLNRCGPLLDAVILDAPKTCLAPPEAAFATFADAGRDCGVVMWRAGGLTPANVGQILRTARYDGVDVARGVEAAAGVKDAGMIQDFIAAVRAEFAFQSTQRERA